MARRVTINDEELISRLTAVFREVGYDGASLSALSEATGLKKASLYHRFPDGKEQMAKEVLVSAEKWLSENILNPLEEQSPPEERIRAMARKLDEFYAGGRQACLLNMLSSSRIHQGPFTKFIKNMFTVWIKALTKVLEESGLEREAARLRSARAIALLQGSLVLARGMGSTKPFRDFLAGLPDELLGQK